MRRDDQLVGPERTERVLDRLDRVAVADLAGRLDARALHRLEARVEPLLGLLPRVVLVGGPVAKRRVERRADDEHARVAPPAIRSRIVVEELRAADRLVRDDQDAVSLGRARLPAPAVPVRPVHGAGRRTTRARRP